MASGETVEWVIGLAGQVPLVGVFIWFTLRLLHLGQAEREAGKDMSARVMNEWRQYMLARDTEWRQFLVDERQARSESMGRLAEEMKSLAQAQVSLEKSLLSHDELLKDLLEQQRRK